MPVRVKLLKGSINPELELCLYNNRWQLATRNALYSDGHKYRPMVMAFDALSEWLPGVKSLMLLGTGLASAIHVLDRRGLVIDSAVLVDVDPHILQLAEMLIPTGAVSNKAFVCADVREYILADDPPHSDLLIVDVFIGRSVPDGICTTDFLSKCKEKINPGGRFVMNYMVSKPESWWAFRKDIEKVFPDNQILEFGLNKLIIGKVSD